MCIRDSHSCDILLVEHMFEICERIFVVVFLLELDKQNLVFVVSGKSAIGVALIGGDCFFESVK